MTASPYLTASEAAEYVRKTPKGFARWVERRGIPVDARAGRIRLWRRDTLDRVLRLDAQKAREAA